MMRRVVRLRERANAEPSRNARRAIPERDFEPVGRRVASSVVLIVVWGVGEEEGGRQVVYVSALAEDEEVVVVLGIVMVPDLMRTFEV